MVRTRSQLEHLSKDELIDELMSIEDISSKLVNLMTWFDNFTGRFEILSSGLFRRGMQSHTHVPTHAQKCLDVW